MSNKAIVLVVAACLVAGLVLNILVATSCDFVELTVPPGDDEGLQLARSVHLGVFQYSVNEKKDDDDNNGNGPSTTATTSPTSTTTTAPTVSSAPSSVPSTTPSWAPTVPGATARPTNVPSGSPTAGPSQPPSDTPTLAPTTKVPSIPPATTTSPSVAPTELLAATAAPTQTTSAAPTTTTTTTMTPTLVPSTMAPTFVPTTGSIVTTAAPTTFVDPNNNATTTTTMSPTITTTGGFQLFDPTNFRHLQDNNNNNSALLLPGTTVPATTDGTCTDFGNSGWDNNPIPNRAAQVGVIMAPVAGGLVLLLVGILTVLVPTLPFAMPLIWTGYLVAQLGLALMWTILQTDAVCDSDVKDECEWQLSTGAWMTIGAHVAYAIAAFASCQLLPHGSSSNPNKPDDNNNNNNNNPQRQSSHQSVRSDDFTPTIVNTAMLEDPTVYDNDERRVLQSLQAELDAQKQAAAMEAGRAQAVAEELQDHEAELAATKEQLWEAQQEAEAHREELAAAAALATATTTVDALRADELEEQLQDQTHKLDETMAAMDQLGTQINEKEVLLAAATAKSAAAAAEAARLQALQAELDKLRETGLGYYPEVWKWLGFKEPGKDVPKTSVVEEKLPDEPQTGYYPVVWTWLGFIEPREYVKRMPDPEGNTAKELLLEKERKAKEDEMMAIAAAMAAARETQQLRDELDQHRKDIQEIKAATRMSISAKQDPPMLDPPDSNPNAVEPEGLRDSQLATPVKALGDDPPQETVTDPANDPDGVRSSAVKKSRAKANAAMSDPPMNTYSDPANDPGGRRSSQTHQKEAPSVHDPPMERMRDPANDPEEIRRSNAGEALRSVDPINHEMQDPSPRSARVSEGFRSSTVAAEQPATPEATTDNTEPLPPRNHDMRKSQ